MMIFGLCSLRSEISLRSGRPESTRQLHHPHRSERIVYTRSPSEVNSVLNQCLSLHGKERGENRKKPEPGSGLRFVRFSFSSAYPSYSRLDSFLLRRLLYSFSSFFTILARFSSSVSPTVPFDLRSQVTERFVLPHLGGSRIVPAASAD